MSAYQTPWCLWRINGVLELDYPTPDCGNIQLGICPAKHSYLG